MIKYLTLTVQDQHERYNILHLTRNYFFIVNNPSGITVVTHFLFFFFFFFGLVALTLEMQKNENFPFNFMFFIFKPLHTIIPGQPVLSKSGCQFLASFSFSGRFL